MVPTYKIHPAVGFARVMHELDRMGEPQLRVELVELRAKIARLETAARMVEEKMKGGAG